MYNWQVELEGPNITELNRCKFMCEKKQSIDYLINEEIWLEKGWLHLLVAGNMLPATQCYFACGGIGIEKTSLLLAKQKWNGEAILKTCVLFIYEKLHYIINMFCENILKIVTS